MAGHCSLVHQLIVHMYARILPHLFKVRRNCSSTSIFDFHDSDHIMKLPARIAATIYAFSTLISADTSQQILWPDEIAAAGNLTTPSANSDVTIECDTIGMVASELSKSGDCAVILQKIPRNFDLKEFRRPGNLPMTFKAEGESKCLIELGMDGNGADMITGLDLSLAATQLVLGCMMTPGSPRAGLAIRTGGKMRGLGNGRRLTLKVDKRRVRGEPEADDEPMGGGVNVM